MIACYKQNIHLLPFADVFLKSLFVFAGGEIAQLVITGGGGGGIAQLIHAELSVKLSFLKYITQPSLMKEKFCCVPLNGSHEKFLFPSPFTGWATKQSKSKFETKQSKLN